MYCIDCKYAAFINGATSAKCELISDHSHNDECEVADQTRDSRLAFTCDKDFYYSELIVTANFGCICFEHC